MDSDEEEDHVQRLERKKIKMQMATCASETLYQLYLNLKKAYDSVDRGNVLGGVE